MGDNVWLLSNCFKILMMQAGFAVVESSFVRQRNSVPFYFIPSACMRKQTRGLEWIGVIRCLHQGTLGCILIQTSVPPYTTHGLTGIMMHEQTDRQIS